MTTSPLLRRLPLALLASSLLTGCSSLPKRSDVIVSQYDAYRRKDVSDAAAITSEYMDLASSLEKGDNSGKHYLSVLDIGDDALLARTHLARTAKETIEVQTFIWHDDETSRFMFDELLKAARRGVKVRMLIDALNPIGKTDLIAQMAVAHENIDICLYRPLVNAAVVNNMGRFKSLLVRFQRLNRRMHNKLFLVDGRVGIVGGRNYEGKYYDRHPQFLFKDRDAVVVGPSVKDMVKSFDAFWEDARAVFLFQFPDIQQQVPRVIMDGPPVFRTASSDDVKAIMRDANAHSLAALRPTLALHEVEDVDFVADYPDSFKGRRGRSSKHIEAKISETLRTAQESIVFETPYLIYDKKIRKRLKKLRAKKPGLKVTVASNSMAAADHLHVYALSFKHRRQLYKSMGLDIYEFKPWPEDMETFVPRYRDLVPLNDEQIEKYTLEGDIAPLKKSAPRLCIHAKAFTVDERISEIGSHNFDPRSGKLNSECGIFITDSAFTKSMNERLLHVTSPNNSWVVGKKNVKETLWNRISAGLGRFFSALPFLDIWPYRYTSVFELREGMEPLASSRDDNFYAHYKDLGQFPEVDSAGSEIQMRLMKAFGGWARPLM